VLSIGGLLSFLFLIILRVPVGSVAGSQWHQLIQFEHLGGLRALVRLPAARNSRSSWRYFLVIN